ncbi:MAG: CPXCG motif-containing cysteine-rich protein [Bacteroidota bacterium]
MEPEEFHSYFCPSCGEKNETLVEPTAGFRQTFVEDCAVCCQANVLTVRIDQETGAVAIDAEPEA